MNKPFAWAHLNCRSPKDEGALFACKKLIVICGPTASGKSKLALSLAKKYNGVIISADSRQIYKEMDIGTDKPYLVKSEKLKVKSDSIIINNVPHYIIDIVKPDQEFTLVDYQKKVFKILNNIYKKNQSLATTYNLQATSYKLKVVPFLVGGTGLYIKSIIDGLIIPKAEPNKKLRTRLERLENKELLKRLKKIDPDTAECIDQNNKRRLIRTLEVCLLTKKPFSKQKRVKTIDFDVLQIGINLPRQRLYKKIDQRIDKMIKAGLIQETKNLLKKYSSPHQKFWCGDMPSMSGIGYKEIRMYLNKEINLEKAVELIKYRTHGLARRQLTWFRKNKRIKWIKSQKEAEVLIQEFLPR
jgi:tRNA dimethylallyltransferase